MEVYKVTWRFINSHGSLQSHMVVYKVAWCSVQSDTVVYKDTW